MGIVSLQAMLCLSVLLVMFFNGFIVSLMSRVMSLACMFDVPVPPGFSKGEEGRLLRKRFGRMNLIATFCAAAPLVIVYSIILSNTKRDAVSAPVLIGIVVALALQAIFLTIAMRLGKKAVQPYAVTSDEASEPFPNQFRSRSFDLQSFPSYKAIALGLYVFFALCTGYTWLMWHAIPGQYPVAWSSSGNVTGTVEKSVFGVFGLPILAVLVTTLLLGINQALRYRMLLKRSTAKGFEGIALLILITSTVFFVPLVLISLWLPLRAAGLRPNSFLVWLLGIPAIASVSALYFFRRARQKATKEVHSKRTRVEEELEAERLNSEHWTWSAFYFNPRDPEWRVTKLLAIGPKELQATPNMAHRKGWLILWALASPWVFIASCIVSLVVSAGAYGVSAKLAEMLGHNG